MVYQLCYGQNLNIREDPDFEEVLKDAKEFKRFTGAGNPVDVIPWIRHILPSKVANFLEITTKGAHRRMRKVTTVVLFIMFTLCIWGGEV
jgi:hypothetical protein